MSRLWEKGLPLDERVLRYTAGEDHLLDARLVRFDVQASIAHAKMLQNQELLGADDCDAICAGLSSLAREFSAGEWQISLADEDVHSALESKLTERIGEAGGRIHLGRSRNDQVLAALRLYLLEAVSEVSTAISALRASLHQLSVAQGHIKLPGTTHMQHAMPSSVALWCGAYDEALEDALTGLQAAKTRLDKNPLGSAAGYGTPGLELDRDMTTDLIGFATTQSPVTAVQLSRGRGECGLLFELTLFMQSLGRLASDLLLYYTQEFGYIELAPEMTTGSSIMPQKKNPDVLELVRAASSSVHAGLSECLMITASLSSGFQRDVQRMKPPLFRGIDLSIDSAEIMSLMISGLTFRSDNINMDDSLYATEEAYALVASEGIPFREAYRRVAKKFAK